MSCKRIQRKNSEIPDKTPSQYTKSAATQMRFSFEFEPALNIKVLIICYKNTLPS